MLFSKFCGGKEMKVAQVGLSWIVVKDIKAAIQYYTETVGLKLVELNEQYGWAELQGHDGGPLLGIAQENEYEKAGKNGVLTFTVATLESAIASMQKKGANLEGDLIEVPGHVKMQTMIDPDGNRFQLCEKLEL